MARGDKHPYKGDLKKFSTTGTMRSTPPEDIEAARVRARGRDPGPYDPVAHAAAGRAIESAASRAVIGRYENKGRAPVHVLTPDQFSSFQATGEWEGMPTPEQYGPQSSGPDDRAWEPVKGA